MGTPQRVALDDVRKGVSLLRLVSTPVLGLLLNMSSCLCPACNTLTLLEPQAAVTHLCAELGIPLLGDIPLQPGIGEDCDRGNPVVLSRPDSRAAEVFRGVATSVR